MTTAPRPRNSSLSFRAPPSPQRPHTETDERRIEMGRIVISENVSLDGVVQDPTGDEGFRRGGWFDEFSGERPRGVGRARARRGARRRRRCCSVGAATTTSPRAGSSRDRRVGRPAERPARSTSCPPRSPSPSGPTRPSCSGDVVSEVSRLKQELDGEIVVYASRPLVQHAARARPRRRAAADRLPGRARRRRAPVRRHERQDRRCACSTRGRSATGSFPSPTNSSRRRRPRGARR